jgi:hypothetical protein
MYNPETFVWTLCYDKPLSTPPSARFGHAFTSAGDKLYVHGGDDNCKLSCLFIGHHLHMQTQKITPPHAELKREAIFVTQKQKNILMQPVDHMLRFELNNTS